MAEPTPSSRPAAGNARPATRRRWGRARFVRAAALLVLVLVMGARTFGSFGLAGLVGALALAVVVVVAALVVMRRAARRHLETRPPGVRWAGTVSVDVASFRQAPPVARSAPRSGPLAALLLGHGLAAGHLVVEADGLTWTPGTLARLAGARRWRLGRFDVVRVETGVVPGVPRYVARGMQVWLSDGSSLYLQAVTAEQLDEALDGLGLRRHRPDR
jgi:hypothetical protein